MTGLEKLQAAMARHKAGRVIEAEGMYRQILADNPGYAECHYLLATALAETGRIQEAVPSYERALELKPEFIPAHNDLGNACRRLGNLDRAIDCFRKITELVPQFPQAHFNLGSALKDRRQFDLALPCFEQALRLKFDYAEALLAIGSILVEQEKLDQAIAAFSRAIAIRPDFADAHCGRAAALVKRQRFDDAIKSCEDALRLNPRLAEAHNNLGSAWRQKGNPDRAEACFQRALELQPDLLDALNNLGSLSVARGDLTKAREWFELALTKNAAFVPALGNLGTVCKDEGQIDEALSCFRKCLDYDPDAIDQHSNLVFTLNYHPATTARMLFEEGSRWNDRHARQFASSSVPLANDPDGNRRLRVGYVSPDFREHPVGRFILSLLASHDHQKFEVFCYSDEHPADALTARCKSYADVWRATHGASDEELAGMVRRDQIDILVDLALHTRGNRLLAFARKPAPVQVTFAGYPGSTGLAAIDYRLTDPFLDPHGTGDEHYREQSIRLSDTFWCDQFVSDEPKVGPLPAVERGVLTFGSLNNICKMNSPVVAVWSDILRSVKNARLLLLAPRGNVRQRLADNFADNGIASDRIDFAALQPRDAYLRTYNQIDIGLDTWPYGGHSTSFDSLWMGVPVVTLLGQTIVGRAGFSQLSNLGLTQLIARTTEEYIQIAVDLANDISKLSEIRRSLRPKMRCSPLTDGLRFARSVESAFRDMWKRHCTGQREET